MKRIIFILNLISIVLISTQTIFANSKWVFIPATPGELKKGDLILSKTPRGALTPLIEGMGNYWDHVGMVIDNEGTFRENTIVYPDKEIMDALIWSDEKFTVNLVGNKISKIIQIPRYLDPNKLRNMGGLQDDSKPDTDSRSVRLTLRDESTRPIVENIAEEMKKLSGGYIFNSYINMEQYKPFVFEGQPSLDQGGQCAGTVWWAVKNAGIEMNIPVRNDPEVIRSCAEAMYINIEAMVTEFRDEYMEEGFADLDQYIEIWGEACKQYNNKMDEANSSQQWYEYLGTFFEALGPWLGTTLFGDYVAKEFRHMIRHYVKYFPAQVANQIVNTFLFNRSYDTTDYWRYHYSDVVSYAAAPDDLVMAGIPNLYCDPTHPDYNIDKCGFTGGQTANSSPYNAVENYSGSGGYYKLIADDENDPLPDPRLTGEDPDITIVSNESKEAPNGGVYKTTFEIVPMPVEVGGQLSKDIYFNITNSNLVTPLELSGTPPVTISGDDEFQIISQPGTTMINGGGRTVFGIRFSFDPSAPGDYSTVVTIPNSDPDEGSYQFTLTVTGVNNAYFIDHPVYYNQCDDEDDFYRPLIGYPYAPNMIKNWSGNRMQWSFPPYKFQNGYFVGTHSKTGGEYAAATTYPFTEDKPDLSRGSCTYWTSAYGGWREKGDDTYVESQIIFNLAPDTYIHLQGHGKASICILSCYVDGKCEYAVSIPENKMCQFLIQWDLVSGFADGTNIVFYLDGVQCFSATSTLTPEKINEFTQSFYQQTWVSNGGDNRPDYVPNSTIDNIIIWNKIVDPDAVFGITSPKVTLD